MAKSLKRIAANRDQVAGISVPRAIALPAAKAEACPTVWDFRNRTETASFGRATGEEFQVITRGTA